MADVKISYIGKSTEQLAMDDGQPRIVIEAIGVKPEHVGHILSRLPDTEASYQIKGDGDKTVQVANKSEITLKWENGDATVKGTFTKGDNAAGFLKRTLDVVDVSEKEQLRLELRGKVDKMIKDNLPPIG